MATAFSPYVFGSPVFAQQAFGNGPCPGPGPCGPPGEEELPTTGGTEKRDKRRYDEQRRLHELILREDQEIAEFIRILLMSDIL